MVDFGTWMLIGCIYAVFYATVFTVVDILRNNAYLHKFDQYVYSREVQNG